MNKKSWDLDKEQRMKLKAYICWLGLLLLAILFVGRLLTEPIGEEEESDEHIHIPVIEHLSNVWIMEAEGDGILIYQDGVQKSYDSNYTPAENVREQVADVTLTDGVVTDIRIKAEKINGRILSADDSFVEVEGYGKLPLADGYKGYRIYKDLAMCTVRDIHIGYNYADLIIEDGEICGILMVKEESMEYIRVLLKSSDYAGLLHQQLIVTADSDYTIQYGNYDNLLQEQYSAGEEITIDTNSEYFTGDRITIIPNVLTGKVVLKNVNRSQGVPSYRGQIELLKTGDGIAVINEVLLEEYLYCVVPSEMPSSYPKEALKAQAICARTYAYGHMQRAGYPQYGAHVDDSTSYQVYNNIVEQESTTTAVKETYGQLLYTAEGEPAETFYYSTSCGVGSDASVWKTEATQALDYIEGKAISQEQMQKAVSVQTDSLEPVLTDDEKSLSDSLRDEKAFVDYIVAKNTDDFEVTEGWYRWTYHVPGMNVEKLCSGLQKRYEANQKLILTMEGDEFVSNPIEDFQTIRDMYISKRGAGGVADEMIIETENATYKVISEHNIRYVLNNGETKVQRQDGSEVNSPSLLPSAFFVLATAKEKEKVVGYTLAGGGFGHGVGMSQNAAKHMANAGYTAGDILLFFYDKCEVKNIY